MEDLKEIKKVFTKYKIYKLRMENECIFDIVDNNNVDKNKVIKTWKNYTSLIDKILNNMEKEYSQILVKIFLENIDRKNLHYSDSTFYWKLKKASHDFFNFLII